MLCTPPSVSEFSHVTLAGDSFYFVCMCKSLTSKHSWVKIVYQLTVSYCLTLNSMTVKAVTVYFDSERWIYSYFTSLTAETAADYCAGGGASMWHCPVNHHPRGGGVSAGFMERWAQHLPLFYSFTSLFREWICTVKHTFTMSLFTLF